MSDERKSILQWMDALVEWTGIPRLARQETPARRLKWLPILFLTVATAGLVSTFIVPSRASLWAALMGGLTAGSVAISQTGPMRTKKPSEFSDEREELWRARSNIFAFGTIALVAWLGILALGFYAIWSGLVGWTVKSPDAPVETLGLWLVVLANYLVLLLILLPTLAR
jgi:hypothetical protein